LFLISNIENVYYYYYQEPYNVPLMAYVNICPDNEASMLNPRSTHEWRYRIYMHELIHVMGFMEPMINDVSSDIVGMDGLTIAISRGVLNWAKWHYDCLYLVYLSIISLFS
jgi:hypothetical protein